MTAAEETFAIFLTKLCQQYAADVKFIDEAFHPFPRLPETSIPRYPEIVYRPRDWTRAI